MHQAFGESKCLHAWTVDPRCMVSEGGLRRRLAAGETLEGALSRPPNLSKTQSSIPSTTLVMAFGELKAVAAWSVDRRCEVSIRVLIKRLRTGMTPEEAMKKRPSRCDILIRAFGETKPISAWLTDPRCEVKCSILLMRLSNGAQAEDAMGSHYTRANRYEGFGVEMTLRQWTQDGRCEVPFRVLKQRLERGISVEVALMSEMPPPFMLREAFGEWKSLLDWSRDPRCVISHTSLRRRVQMGIPLEEALTTLREVSRNYGCKGTVPAFEDAKSLRQWAEDERCKLTARGVSARLKKGISPQDALCKPPLHDGKPILFTGHGETKSIQAWSKDPRCHVSRPTLALRLHRGESVESALRGKDSGNS